MSNWRPDFDPLHLYFLTTTAVQRAHIFQRDVIKRILADGLYYLRAVGRTKLYKLYAFVWSSARFYLLDEPALIPLDDARELF